MMTSIPGEPMSDTVDKSQTVSNLSIRIVTALILLPVALLASYMGGWLLTAILAALSIIAALEFYVFAQGRQVQGSALVGVPMVMVIILAFHFRQDVLWMGALIVGAPVTFILETLRHPHDLRRSLWQVATTLAGVIYIAFPAGFMIAIRQTGFNWLMVVFAATWGTDTFAYFGGRLWGKTKLAPVLSPKKTLEGAIAGVIGGVIPAGVVLMLSSTLSMMSIVLVGIAPLVAIAGDLFESAIKRFFHIKDSHIRGFNIFPGHGGVLDRVDSLIAVSTLTYIFLAVSGAAG